MKGRDAFSRQQLAEIRKLLLDKELAASADKKRFRDQLRKDLKFFISDFSTKPGEFTKDDLDSLIDRGAIRVI